MSMYSGFETEELELDYNKALYSLIYLLQAKIHRDNINGNIYLVL